MTNININTKIAPAPSFTLPEELCSQQAGTSGAITHPIRRATTRPTAKEIDNNQHHPTWRTLLSTSRNKWCSLSTRKYSSTWLFLCSPCATTPYPRCPLARDTVDNLVAACSLSEIDSTAAYILHACCYHSSVDTMLRSCFVKVSCRLGRLDRFLLLLRSVLWWWWCRVCK